MSLPKSSVRTTPDVACVGADRLEVPTIVVSAGVWLGTRAGCVMTIVLDMRSSERHDMTMGGARRKLAWTGVVSVALMTVTEL